MKSDTAVKELLMTPIAIAFGGVAMFLLHYWRLPRWVADFLPLARATVAFLIGGFCIGSIAQFARCETPGWVRRPLTLLSSIALLIALAGLYLIPHFCNYWRVAREVAAGTAQGKAFDVSGLISDQGLLGYFKIVGSTRIHLNPDDLPDGAGLGDFLLLIAQLVDQGLQWLCASVLNLPIAGYVSLGVWFLVFLAIAYVGYETIRDHA